MVRDDRPPGAGPRQLAVPAVLGLGVLVVLAAATDTSWDVTDRFGWWGDAPSYPPVVQPLAPPASSTPPPLQDSELGSVAVPVLWGLLVVVVLAAAFWLWRVLPRRARRARTPTTPGAHELGRGAEPSAPVVHEGVGAALQLLETVADPTDAVLAAWVALEGAAARSGVPRHPADTPTEFTVRVLTVTHADADAATRLLGLYHRARFSAGGVEAGAVAEARRCLTVLDRSWARATAREGAG